jgi:tRNA nucleotidyltransferase/poly(A) polymerase
VFNERGIATDVARLLQCHGFDAYFVGGCVRDKILGLEPNDFDVSSNAPLSEVLSLISPMSETAPVIGTNYPVAKFTIRGFKIDVTSMKNGSLTDDTNRRDFTMNAMFENPVTGEVVDLLGGVSDLTEGVLRGIGDVDEHMVDDTRRMLRAPRFAAKFGFEIESSIWCATRRHAHLVASLDSDWVAKECRTMVACSRPDLARNFVMGTGLLDFIPEAVVNECFGQAPGTVRMCEPAAHPVRSCDAMSASFLPNFTGGA